MGRLQSPPSSAAGFVGEVLRTLTPAGLGAVVCGEQDLDLGALREKAKSAAGSYRVPE